MASLKGANSQMAVSASRRKFLKTAARGLGLSWGGLRIVAGREPEWFRVGQGHAPAPETVQPPSRADRFVYGAEFYRPPNPPRSQRRAMLKTIAQQYQFNLIRVFPTWDYYNPVPGKFVFDEVEEVMAYCDEFGIRVLMGLVLEAAPYWLEETHPEARYVDAKGQRHRLEGNAGRITGGWPGLCPDWEPVREAARDFIHELVKVVAPHPSMYAYDVWNEPHVEPSSYGSIWATPPERLYCYCEKTIAGFRAWLEKRYGTIPRLNEAWTRRLPDWEAIDAPRALGTYADWVDWRRYMIDWCTQFLRFRVATVREVDSRHFIASHGTFHPPIDPTAEPAINGWRLAEAVEVWGLSCFPRGVRPLVYPGAAKFEITRSNAAGKDFWITELQGGHGNAGLWRSPEMRPQDIRLWNWIAVATGAKGIVYWAYLAEATGREATGFGLVTRDGAKTDRVEEAAKNNRLIQSYWDVIKDYRPEPRVAILFDQDNALLSFAMSGDENVSTQSSLGYYKALWNLDHWVDFLEPTYINLHRYQVLIAPWHLIGRRGTCEAFERFVLAGGTLILETAFGLFDEHFYHNPVVPPHGLHEAFGYREQTSFIVYRAPAPKDIAASDQIYYEPEIVFSAPVNARLKAHTFLTPIEILSATPIARSFGFTVAARKSLGKGQVYYLGTNLGASIAAGDDGGIDLLRAIVNPVVRPEVTAKNLRPRLIRGSRRSLLVVFNDTPQDQSSVVALPAGYRRALDVHRQVEIPVREEGIEVTVPYEDALVVELG